jgi:hypothetical protein
MAIRIAQNGEEMRYGNFIVRTPLSEFLSLLMFALS